MAPASKRQVGSLRLNFSNCRLTLQKLIDALEGLPLQRIDELNASQNNLGDRSPKQLLRLLPQLRVLCLNSAGLSAEGLRSAIEGLTECWLEGTEKGLREASSPVSKPAVDKSISAFSMASPASTTRGSCVVGSPTARCLTGPGTMCKLQVLEMAACNADAAVPDLALYLASPCCSLTELNLSWNSLGPHAVQQLGWHLRQNVTLRSLKLAHCHLKQSASVLLACLNTAKGILLERLDLSRNEVPVTAFEELASFLKSEPGRRLMDLDISGNGATVEESCSRVLGRALLEENASGNSPRGSGMKLHLGGTKPFFDPAYGRWDAGPQLLSVLRSPTSRVLEVNLDHCSFTEAAVSSLARISLNVRSFSLCNCDGAEGTLGQSFVVHFEDLTRGLLRRRGADPDASPSSPRAEESVTLQAARGRQRGLRLILRELRLNDLQLQDGSVLLLSQALDRLQLARVANVEVLELEGNHLTHEGVMGLNLTPLRRLNLSRNKLRPLGGMCLGDLLATRASQVAVPLLDLELRRCCLTPEGILSLWQQVLPDQARVRRLNLAENGLDAATVQAMLDLALDTGSVSTLQELQLIPNPCGGSQGASSAAVSQLFQRFAPLKSLTLQAPEIPALVQQMIFLGDTTDESLEDQEFVISLQSLRVLPNEWKFLKDALVAATAPPMQPTNSVRMPRRDDGVSSPKRRLGGCGGSLRLEFSNCDLSQACFRVPKLEPEAGPTSIAKSARREWSKVKCISGEDTPSASSSHRPFRPPRRSAKQVAAPEGERAGKVVAEAEASTSNQGQMSTNQRTGDLSGASAINAMARRIPALRICREENFGILFERTWHVDLQVSTVLRELRNVQGVRLVRCGLTDNWLAQLGHSGNSSKWNAIRLLDLRYNALTSSCCPALATVISGGLQALLLDGNRLQSQGFEALCKTMTGSKPSLRSLSVADNGLGHPCGTLAADLFARHDCPLKELALAENSISSGEIICLLRTLAKLAVSEDLYVDLAQTAVQPQVLPFAAKALVRCRGLVINLAGCRGLLSEHFEADLYGLQPGRLVL